MLSKAFCNVYWVHLPEHTDISTEGYVGITIKTVAKRFAQHKVRAKRGDAYTFSNAIVKHGKSLVCTTLLQGSVEYCRYIENKLRPTPNVGWNINIGGDVPPMSGRTHTSESRAKMSASNNRELSRKSMLRNIVTDNPWMALAANKTMWLNAGVFFDIIRDNPTLGYRGIQRVSGLKRSVGNCNNIFNKIKNKGYNPHKDSEWVNWVNSVNQGVLS